MNEWRWETRELTPVQTWETKQISVSNFSWLFYTLFVSHFEQRGFFFVHDFVVFEFIHQLVFFLMAHLIFC